MIPGLNKVPAIILTGFLGSGKTTLLNRILADGIKTAVIINEFGQTPVDQDLLQQQNLPMTVLSGGCLCCQIKGALAPVLKNLHRAWAVTLPRPFQRVIIETSGVASPEPILDTLLREPWIAKRYSLQQVLTTLAVPSAQEHLERFAEAAAQVTWADKLLLTHADLADAAQHAALLERLNGLAPGTPKLTVTSGKASIAEIMDRRQTGYRRLPGQGVVAEHGFSALSVYLGQMPNWQHVQTILQDLLERYPDNLLRLKGVVFVPDQDRPIAVQAAAGRLYPPQVLPVDDSKDRRSRLVLIASSGIEVLADELALAFAEYLERNAIRLH